MKALALLPALALAACAATTPPARPTGTPTAGFGQTATAGSLLVTPIALIEDSRCPINARCVWAGRLTVKVRVSFHGGSEEMVGPVTLGQSMPLGRTSLALVAAAPDKVAGQPSSPADYRFTFAEAAYP